MANERFPTLLDRNPLHPLPTKDRGGRSEHLANISPNSNLSIPNTVIWVKAESSRVEGGPFLFRVRCHGITLTLSMAKTPVMRHACIRGIFSPGAEKAFLECQISGWYVSSLCTSKFLDSKNLHDRFPIPGLNVSGTVLNYRFFYFFFTSPLITYSSTVPVDP